MKELHMVFSSGAIGLALVDELCARGFKTIYVDITGTRGYRQHKGESNVAFHSLAEPNSESLAILGKDVKVVYQCFHPDEMPKPLVQWPAWQRTISHWAATQRIAYVLLQNLEPYGSNTPMPITAETPVEPDTPLGEMLLQLSQEWHALRLKENLPWTVGICGDAFGPHMRRGPLGEALFKMAITDKKVTVPSDLEQPHSFHFTPDLARSLVILGERSQAWGHSWILPSPPPSTLSQFLNLISEHLKKPISIAPHSKTRHRVAALIYPKLKQDSRTFTRFEMPLTVNSRTIECAFGVQGAPMKTAIADTCAWFEEEIRLATIQGKSEESSANEMNKPLSRRPHTPQFN